MNPSLLIGLLSPVLGFFVHAAELDPFPYERERAVNRYLHLCLQTGLTLAGMANPDASGLEERALRPFLASRLKGIDYFRGILQNGARGEAGRPFGQELGEIAQSLAVVKTPERGRELTPLEYALRTAITRLGRLCATSDQRLAAVSLHAQLREIVDQHPADYSGHIRTDVHALLDQLDRHVANQQRTATHFRAQIEAMRVDLKDLSATADAEELRAARASRVTETLVREVERARATMKMFDQAEWGRTRVEIIGLPQESWSGFRAQLELELREQLAALRGRGASEFSPNLDLVARIKLLPSRSRFGRSEGTLEYGASLTLTQRAGPLTAEIETSYTWSYNGQRKTDALPAEMIPRVFGASYAEFAASTRHLPPVRLAVAKVAAQVEDLCQRALEDPAIF